MIITKGSKGAVGYTKRSKVSVSPEPVKVVDTVGAGDTFNAGILASLHDQGALAKAADRQPVGGGGPCRADARREGRGRDRVAGRRQPALAQRNRAEAGLKRRQAAIN